MDVFKPKRGSHDAIYAINPKLEEGEVVFEYPRKNNRGYGIIKIGDGVHYYNELPVFIAAITDYIPESEKGAINGIVPLNDAGLIEERFLPSYVDDILEFDSFDDFPDPGEKGKIYIDTSVTTNNVYRWSGSMYICIGTNVKYRLIQDKNVIKLIGTDNSVNIVDVTQIHEFSSYNEFPEEGSTGNIYIDTSKDNNNLYRWDETDNTYKQICKSTTYTLTTSSTQLSIKGSDGSESSVNISNINTTYILTTSATQLKIKGSNNTESAVNISNINTTYDLTTSGSSLVLKGSDNSQKTIPNAVVTYDLTTSGSSLILKGSNGGQSTVSNVGGVEIRSTDPSAAELYPGKMWIKV